MSNSSKTLSDNDTTWPPLVKYECAGDITDKRLKEIKEAAKAPDLEGDDWKTVDGPGW